MNSEENSAAPQDQTTFYVDADTFRQFCELLDAPPKENPGLARLMALTPVWAKTPVIDAPDEDG